MFEGTPESILVMKKVMKSVLPVRILIQYRDTEENAYVIMDTLEIHL